MKVLKQIIKEIEENNINEERSKDFYQFNIKKFGNSIWISNNLTFMLIDLSKELILNSIDFSFSTEEKTYIRIEKHNII